MIDKIASVLYGGNLADCHFPEYFRRKARQCIEAMAEPTPAMVELGAAAGEMYGNTDAKASWQAMVKAALDETCKGEESPK